MVASSATIDMSVGLTW